MAVESEGELVELVVQMLGADSALIGAQKPPIEQRDHAMSAWGQVLLFWLMHLHLAAWT